MTTDHDPIVFVISDDDECPTTSNMSTAKDLQAAVVLDIPKPTPAPKKNRGQPPGYIAPKNTGKASGYRPLNHNANESQLYIQRPNLQNHPYASSQNPKPKNDYIDQDCVLYHIQGGSHQPSSHDLFALNTVPDSAIMLPSPAQGKKLVQPRLSFPLLDASFGLVRPAPVFPKPFVLPKPLKAPKVPKATKVPKPVFSTDVKAVFGSAPSKAKTTQQSKVIAPIIVQKPVKAPITVQKPHPTSHQLSGFLKTQSVHGAGLKSFPVNGSGLKIHSVQGAGPLGFKIPVVQKSELGGDPAFQRPPSFYNPIDDLDPLLIENKRQSLLFKLKPLNLENLSKLPTEIRQIQGLHHFLTVFGKPLLCWADAIPNFVEFCSWFEQKSNNPAALLAWYAHLLQFLCGKKATSKLMTHCQLEKYVLDYSEVLSKKIGLSEFCDILGSTHIAAFQLLVDDIIDEESFRQYLSEDKERIADLRNSSKYILESRKEIVHEQQKLQRLKYSMQMAIHKDAVQKPDLGFDASSFIKTNGAYSSVFYLAALDAIGDKDRIKLYDDLIEALEEIEKKIAASDLELANVKKASELLKSLGREKETGAAIDNYFLGYDRNGRGFWYIPIKDTERIASTTVFGVLANDPQSPHDWFSIGGIADLVALFGSLSPHGIRECALRKALGQLHSKFGISLRNWDASAATAQVFMLDKSYKMFSDWLLESKIPSEEVQTYLEEDLCELSKTVDELFSTCKIEQHQTLDAVSLGNTCAIKYQLMICEELIQNPAIWTMLQDDTDTLTELKNISSLYRWCLKAMEKVKHELATQERERDEILKKEAMEIGRARARAEQEKEIPMEEVVSRSGRVIAMPLNWSAVIPPVTKVPSPSAKPAKVTLAKASKPDSGRRSSRLSNRVSVDEDSSPLEESSLSADENSSSSDFGAKGRKRSSRLATRRSSRDRSSTSRLDSGRKRKQKARLATRSKSVDNSQSSDTDSRIKRPTSGRLTRSRTATTVDDNSQSSDPEPSAKRPSSSRLTRSNKKVVDVSDEDKSEQSSSESSSVDDDHGISISKAPKNSIRVLVSNPRKGLIIEASSDEMTSRSESSDVDDAGSIHSEAVAPARTLRSRKMSLESASLEIALDSANEKY